MQRQKQERLAKAGWQVGSAAEFLSLTAAEAAYVEMKLALAHELRRTRRHRRITQKKLASMLKTSQLRLAVMERGDPSVSLDLLVRAHLTLGGGPWRAAFASGPSHTAARASRRNR